MRTLLLIPFAAVLILTACNAPSSAGDVGPVAREDSSGPADSLTSMPYLLRRFQARGRHAPTAFSGGASTVDALVSRYLTALERRGIASIDSLLITRSEFAYLYFPESIFMRPPYELDPEVLWLQVDAASRTGLRRALTAYGGVSLRSVAVRCAAPDSQGSVRVHGCDVMRLNAAGDTIRERLFGAIVERGGTFKFLSLQNGL